MKPYNQIIRELREDHDLTQAEVADILHTRQEYYSKYELGKRKLPIEHLKTLCEYYNVSANYILGISEDSYDPRKHKTTPPQNRKIQGPRARTKEKIMQNQIKIPIYDKNGNITAYKIADKRKRENTIPQTED